MPLNIHSWLSTKQILSTALQALLPVLLQTVARSNLNVPIILFGRRTLLLWNTLNNTEQLDGQWNWMKAKEEQNPFNEAMKNLIYLPN